MISVRAVYAILLALTLASPVWLWFDLQPGQQWRESVPPEFPAPAASPDEGLLGKVMAKNLWDQQRGQIVVEGQGGKAAVGAESTSCELKAIAHAQMMAPLAIFACSGKEIDSWTEHDTLPDKSLLAEIHADHVVIEQGEERRNVYLFGKE